MLFVRFWVEFQASLTVMELVLSYRGAGACVGFYDAQRDEVRRSSSLFTRLVHFFEAAARALPRAEAKAPARRLHRRWKEFSSQFPATALPKFSALLPFTTPWDAAEGNFFSVFCLYYILRKQARITFQK